MNGAPYNNHLKNRMNRWMKWPLLCGLVGMALTHAAFATDPLYQNFAVQDYFVPGNPPPSLDVIAFDNENTFNVNYSIYSPNTVFYEPLNTLFYTNNGVMTVNTPFLNLNGFIFIGGTFGCGFQFDLKTTNVVPHVMADTFYNAGTIRCNSILDSNGIYTFGSTTYFILNSIGRCIVSATNIITRGTMIVGVNGLMQFKGQNVDLSRSTLGIENLQSLFWVIRSA
ncbi:MAG: hypothetical protein WDM76_11710 [Limisphaerales bacterium]